ncbi:MAG: surface lipoprotein assembly modifier [Pseudomonadota bacterium]|nr:surface lipoprotein assembly modifier [Pseudomonadota bacterium]
MTKHDLTKASPLLLASAIGVMVATPLLAAVAEPAPQQQNETLDVSGSVAAGIEYNDNLSVTELETAAGTGDTAATLEANADVNWQAGENTSVAGGYSFSGSRYQDVDAFDLDLHLLYADVSHDFALLTLGANYYFADARLGGDSFLELNQYSLYAGKLFADAWYLRGALNFTDKQFDVFDVRDADNEGFSTDLYRFFNAGRSNVMLGYAYEDEDTRGPAFDYSADTLRLRLNHRFTLMERSARVLLGYRWQDRDYANATPAIGVPRDDSQRVVEAQFEVDVIENLALTAGWEYGDYDSRLPSADFTANRVAMAMRLSF